MSEAKVKGLIPTWVYQNADGSPHSGIIERNKKGRPAREVLHYDEGKSQFVPGFNNHEQILYALPKISKAQKIILCDNENIVEELLKLRYPATCGPAGFSGWSYHNAKQLKNKSVLILRSEDPDETRATENRVIPTLIDRVSDFYILTVPSKSVGDWLKKTSKDKIQKSIELLKESKDDWFVKLREKQTRLTDSGNAEIFALMWCDTVRYVTDKEIWINWDGKHWKPDTTGYTLGLTKAAANELWKEVKKRHGTEDTTDIQQWAKQSLSSASRNNMLKLAKNEELLRITQDRLDQNPHLINLKNGTYDLGENKFRDHERKDFLTHCLDVNYNFNAPDKNWIKFIDQITEGDEDKARYLQQAAGYTLSGVTDHQLFFFLHGPGGSGKSTFTEIILSIMGSLATKVPTELFMESDGGSKPFELANLVGKRFVLAQEVQQGHLWNEGRLKDATGQDTINAEKKHRDSFTYKPQFKLWFYANHWPSLRNVDKSIMRRMRIVPLTFQPKKLEKGLQAKLLQEREGILVWMINGFLDLQQSGWAKCEAVENAAKKYFAEQDVVNLFCDESCKFVAGIEVKSSELYKLYCEYCKENGYNAYSQRRFGEVLTQKGVEQIRRESGRVWRGIALKIGNI